MSQHETITIDDDSELDESEFNHCEFCIILTHKSELLQLSSCGHMACRDCIESLVTNTLNVDIACLNDYCDKYFFDWELRDFVQSAIFENYITRRKVAERFQSLDLAVPTTTSHCSTCGKPIESQSVQSADTCNCATDKRKVELGGAGSGGPSPSKVPRTEVEELWDSTWKVMCEKYNKVGNNTDAYANLVNAYEWELQNFLNNAGQNAVGASEDDVHFLDFVSNITTTSSPTLSTEGTSIPASGVYKCYNLQCLGFTTHAPNNIFRCPVCHLLNCVNCRAQHGGLLCSDYQKTKSQACNGTSSAASTSTATTIESNSTGIALKNLTTKDFKGISNYAIATLKYFIALPQFGNMIWQAKAGQTGILKVKRSDGTVHAINTLHISPTFPFDAMKFLLLTLDLATREGRDMRHGILQHQLLRFSAVSLAIFAHTSYQESNLEGLEPKLREVLKTVEDTIKLNCYGGGKRKSSPRASAASAGWAKGTGYGSGSVSSSTSKTVANIETKMNKQEMYLVSIFDMMTTFVDPVECREIVPILKTSNGIYLWPILSSLLKETPVLEVVITSLRNDSLLDLTRHIPYISSILRFVKVIASVRHLEDLITKPLNPNEPSISSLVAKLKEIGDAYGERLSNGSQRVPGLVKSDDEQLVDLISSAARVIRRAEVRSGAPKSLPSATVTSASSSPATSNQPSPILATNLSFGTQLPANANPKSKEAVYLEEMKKLQFGYYDMIESNGSQPPAFTVAHAFADELLKYANSTPLRTKRLAQETVTLSKALPLSYGSSIFIRSDTNRLDVVKVLITGPVGTPYANGCFEFDVCFPPEYPNVPPKVQLKTTGNGSVRFNPNLYNCGKVCLSILNTWTGRPEERWNPKTSSLLPVFVAIQSLVLTSDPYFNEPGFENWRGTASGQERSRTYNNDIRAGTIRWAMIDQIVNPTPCFRDVIHSHFWLKREAILEECGTWIDSNATSSPSRLASVPGVSSVLNAANYVTSSIGNALYGAGSTSTSAVGQQLTVLKAELAKLQPPRGLTTQ